MKILAVPIKIDALVLNEARAVVGPLVDFHRMPFSENGVDINPDMPYLGSELANEPFADDTLVLDAGCHLHWALPEAITHSMDGQGAEYPAVPDRWLISRRSGGSWLVESDHITDVPNGSSLFPLRSHDPSEIKTLYLGRSLSLPDEASEVSRGTYMTGLTAIGHGDPTFHAFYPNCRSVFGFHDPQGATGDAYDILGWYDDQRDDHVVRSIGTIRADLASKRLVPEKDENELDCIIRTLLERCGWRCDQEHMLPDRMICYGSIEISATAAGKRPNNAPTDQHTVAIASTGTEALSALVARSIGLDPASQVVVEEQLEALHLSSALRGHKLDIDQKFKEARHARGFSAIDGGSRWGLRPVPKDQASASDQAAELRMDRLPLGTAEELDRINALQADLDQALDERNSLRLQLYSDHHKYMVSSYPTPAAQLAYPEIDDIVSYISGVAIPDIAALDARIGKKAQSEQEESTGLYGEVEAARVRINALLDPNTFELMQRPASRYWRPNEPVVMLSGHADASDRHGTGGKIRCALIHWDPNTDLTTWLVAQAATFSMQEPFGRAGTDRATGLTRSNASAGHTLLLEWEAELFPVEAGNALGNPARMYATDFLHKSFKFDPDGLELITDADTMKGASIYAGRSILTPNSSITLRAAMEAFFRERISPATIDAWFATVDAAEKRDAKRDEWLVDHYSDLALWYLSGHPFGLLSVSDVLVMLQWTTDRLRERAVGDVLKRFQVDTGATRDVLSDDDAAAFAHWYRRELHLIEFLLIYREHVADMDHVLSQSLSGFNDALLMHRQCYSLPVEEPLGFPDYRAFTAEVAEMIGPEHGQIPQPLNDFMPIRSGLFKLHRLRLVDTFGLTNEIVHNDEDVIYPSTWTGQDGLCHLPPRFMQPAQLDLRWLPAGRTELDHVSDHPDTGPVCGWLLANELDDSIAVYAANGTVLGSIVHEKNGPAAWHPPPGGAGADDPSRIDDPYLKGAVNAIKRGNVNEMIDLLSETLGTIDPENFEQHQATALLMGRPLAVVRAGVKLKLKGAPAIDQSWEELITDMATGRTMLERNHAGMERVEVQVKIGDHEQVNDGVAGFWRELGGEDEQGAILDTFQRCSSDARPELTITSSNRSERFVLLLDPRAKVHARSGVLPVRSLELDAHHFTTTLSKIEVTFLTTPIITGVDLVAVPLPDEAGKAWSWIERHGTEWSELDTEGLLKRSMLDRLQPTNTGHDVPKREIWEALSHRHWIVPVANDDDTARVSPTDQRSGALGDDLAGYTEQVEHLLRCTHIVSPDIQPPFQQENMIREGWLKLRNAPSANTNPLQLAPAPVQSTH